MKTLSLPVGLSAVIIYFGNVFFFENLMALPINRKYE